MSSPGWYPDPANVPHRLRYWDGRAWTTQIQDAPAGGGFGAAPGGDPQPSGGGKGWLWALLAGALVVVVVVVLVITNPFASIAGDAPVATYSPTISAWNESETPTPTPSPSLPSPSITNLRCDQDGSPRYVDTSNTTQRVQVGAMSMPVPAGWSGPSLIPLVRYLDGGVGYRLTIEPSWANVMLIGPTNFADPKTSLETQARTIVACLAGDTAMGRYRAPEKLEISTVSVSGRSGVQADAVYVWKDTDIKSKGSHIRVVVVDTSDGPYAFFGEATSERPDVIALMDSLTSQLAVR